MALTTEVLHPGQEIIAQDMREEWTGKMVQELCLNLLESIRRKKMTIKLTEEQEKRMEKLRKKDYSSLIGKEIEWHYPDNPSITETGIVTMIDPDLGITIVNKKDKEDYLTCIYGVMGVGIAYPEEEFSEEYIDRTITQMERRIGQIENGIMCTKYTLEAPSAKTCIFNK